VAVKRALSRAGYMRWGAFTPTWGDFAVKAVRAFQRAHDLEITGNYGEKTPAKLLLVHRKDHQDEWAWDSYSARIVRDFCKEFNAAPEDRVRRAIAAAAYYWSCKRNQIHYSEVRPFQLVEPPDIPARIDCSGFVTLCHKAGVAVNPNRPSVGRARLHRHAARRRAQVQGREGIEAGRLRLLRIHEASTAGIRSRQSDSRGALRRGRLRHHAGQRRRAGTRPLQLLVADQLLHDLRRRLTRRSTFRES